MSTNGKIKPDYDRAYDLNTAAIWLLNHGHEAIGPDLTLTKINWGSNGSWVPRVAVGGHTCLLMFEREDPNNIYRPGDKWETLVLETTADLQEAQRVADWLDWNERFAPLEEYAAAHKLLEVEAAR